MSFIHGKATVVKLNAVTLSTFMKKTDFKRNADKHDVTTYGKNSKVWKGGLKDATVSHEGVYDDGAAGPRATILPLLGTNVTWIFQPEGAGAGLAQSTGTVLVEAYNESDPVDGMITFTLELQCSDDINDTDQS